MTLTFDTWGALHHHFRDTPPYIGQVVGLASMAPETVRWSGTAWVTAPAEEAMPLGNPLDTKVALLSRDVIVLAENDQKILQRLATLERLEALRRRPDADEPDMGWVRVQVAEIHSDPQGNGFLATVKLSSLPGWLRPAKSVTIIEVR